MHYIKYDPGVNLFTDTRKSSLKHWRKTLSPTQHGNVTYANASNYFWPIFSFCTQWTQKRNFVILLFLGDIKWKHWPKMHWVKCVRIRIFLVRIFSHSDWIRGDTEYLSVFSPNAGKYGPEILRIRTLFRQWKLRIKRLKNSFRLIYLWEGITTVSR